MTHMVAGQHKLVTELPPFPIQASSSCMLATAPPGSPSGCSSVSASSSGSGRDSTRDSRLSLVCEKIDQLLQGMVLVLDHINEELKPVHIGAVVASRPLAARVGQPPEVYDIGELCTNVAVQTGFDNVRLTGPGSVASTGSQTSPFRKARRCRVNGKATQVDSDDLRVPTRASASSSSARGSSRCSSSSSSGSGSGCSEDSSSWAGGTSSDPRVLELIEKMDGAIDELRRSRSGVG